MTIELQIILDRRKGYEDDLANIGRDSSEAQGCRSVAVEKHPAGLSDAITRYFYFN
jgi:hypothetical protein